MKKQPPNTSTPSSTAGGSTRMSSPPAPYRIGRRCAGANGPAAISGTGRQSSDAPGIDAASSQAGVANNTSGSVMQRPSASPSSAIRTSRALLDVEPPFEPEPVGEHDVEDVAPLGLEGRRCLDEERHA